MARGPFCVDGQGEAVAVAAWNFDGEDRDKVRRLRD